MAVHRLLGVALFAVRVAFSAVVRAEDAVAPPPTTASEVTPPGGGTPPPVTPPPLSPAEQQKKMDGLRKDVDDLKTAAADAKKGSSDEKLADSFKQGKLIRYGITAGAAVAVHWSASSMQDQPGVSAMPYIAVLPWWWFRRMGKITRAFCTQSFLTGWDSAKRAANQAAEDWAVETVQRLNTLNPRYLGVVQDPDSGVNDWHTLIETKETESKPAEASLPRVKDDPDFAHASEKELIAEFIAHPGKYPGNVYDMVGWNERKNGNCSMLWLGAYVGVPTKYTVNGKAQDGDPLKAREFNPVVSFGVVVTPISAVALMVGATYARVASDIATASPTPMKLDDNPGSYHGTFALTLGVGGNLDLVGALLK